MAFFFYIYYNNMGMYEKENFYNYFNDDNDCIIYEYFFWL